MLLGCPVLENDSRFSAPETAFLRWSSCQSAIPRGGRHFFRAATAANSSCPKAVPAMPQRCCERRGEQSGGPPSQGIAYYCRPVWCPFKGGVQYGRDEEGGVGGGVCRIDCVLAERSGA